MINCKLFRTISEKKFEDKIGYFYFFQKVKVTFVLILHSIIQIPISIPHALIYTLYALSRYTPQAAAPPLPSPLLQPYNTS